MVIKNLNVVIYCILGHLHLFCLCLQMASFEEGKIKMPFIYSEGLDGDLKISFTKCNKIPCIFRFLVSIHVNI